MSDQRRPGDPTPESITALELGKLAAEAGQRLGELDDVRAEILGDLEENREAVDRLAVIAATLASKKELEEERRRRRRMWAALALFLVLAGVNVIALLVLLGVAQGNRELGCADAENLEETIAQLRHAFPQIPELDLETPDYCNEENAQ